MTGYGFDQAVLEMADMRRADAFAAVSSGDNSNIIAARVARETFGIQQVVARIYDPGRAEVYQQELRDHHGRHGQVDLPTQYLGGSSTPGAEPDFRDPLGTIRVDHVMVPEDWVGHRTVAPPGAVHDSRIAWIDRLGEGMLPHRDSVLQEGDMIHLVVREENAARRLCPCSTQRTARSELRPTCESPSPEPGPSAARSPAS